MDIEIYIVQGFTFARLPGSIKQVGVGHRGWCVYALARGRGVHFRLPPAVLVTSGSPLDRLCWASWCRFCSLSLLPSILLMLLFSVYGSPKLREWADFSALGVLAS